MLRPEAQPTDVARQFRFFGRHRQSPLARSRPIAWARPCASVCLRQTECGFVSPHKPGPINIGDEDLSHISNWFACLRSGNKKTNATVDNGFLHAVAVIMAAQSYWQGKRLYYDSAGE
jgi:hypothetical protein